MADDYLLEQYKIITSSFDAEITRFWTRFNILVGLEIGGLLGVFAASKVLILNPGLFRIALMAMTFFSFAATVIIWRGYLMHQTILRMIVEIEKRSEGKLQMLRIAGQTSRIPIGLNQIVAIGIALVLAIFWVVLWIYAELIGYNFVPPS
jgi:hypothetical protein